MNCWGLRSEKKRNLLYEWLKQKKYDIILLQETHITENMVHQMERNWNGKLYQSVSTSSHHSGVCTLINPTLEIKIIETIIDEEGRLLILKTEMEESIYCIVNVYMPTKLKDRKYFIKTLEKKLLQENMNANYLIIAGDMNICRNIEDRSTVTHIRDETRLLLEYVMRKLNLLDCWELDKREKYRYTWSNPTGVIKSRLDYYFISKELRPKVKDFATKIVISDKVGKRLTDHKLIEITVKVNTPLKGPGYWKFNNKFLEDAEFCRDIINIIKKNTVEESKKGAREQWEHLKREIKSFSMKYGKDRARNNKKHIQSLEKRLNK